MSTTVSDESPNKILQHMKSNPQRYSQTLSALAERQSRESPTTPITSLPTHTPSHTTAKSTPGKTRVIKPSYKKFVLIGNDNVLNQKFMSMVGQGAVQVEDDESSDLVGCTYVDRTIVNKFDQTAYIVTLWQLGITGNYISLIPSLASECECVILVFDLSSELAELTANDFDIATTASSKNSIDSQMKVLENLYSEFRKHNTTAIPFFVGLKYDKFSTYAIPIAPKPRPISTPTSPNTPLTPYVKQLQQNMFNEQVTTNIQQLTKAKANMELTIRKCKQLARRLKTGLAFVSETDTSNVTELFELAVGLTKGPYLLTPSRSNNALLEYHNLLLSQQTENRK